MSLIGASWFFQVAEMAQEHITLRHNKDDGYFTVEINGVEAGSVRTEVSNSSDLLEWMFEIVYLRGAEMGRALLRRDINSLLHGNGSVGLTLPIRPEQAPEFKDWPVIKASEIYAQLNKEMKDHAD